MIEIRRKSKRTSGRFALLGLCLLLPNLMGGCPEFRNESVTAMETAVRGLVDATLSLVFDFYRTDT